MRLSVETVTDSDAQAHLVKWLDWAVRLTDYLDPAVNPGILATAKFDVRSIVGPDDPALQGIGAAALPGPPPFYDE